MPNFRLTRALCCALLSMTTGCSVTQPLLETTTATVMAPLPGGKGQFEARRACLEHVRLEHDLVRGSGSDASLDQELADFQLLAERALVYRAEFQRLAGALRAKLERSEPLSGLDLARLKQGTAEYLDLRAKLLHTAQAHECWLDADLSATADAEAAAKARLTGVMISLGAALVLYDNYLLAVSQFQEDNQLRRYLNDKDAGYGIDYGELNRMALSFASVENRARVRRAIGFFESESQHLGAKLEQDTALHYLSLLITQSPSYNMTRRLSPLSPLYMLGRKIDFLAPLTFDSLSGLKDEGVNLSSMVFGNMVGLVETRHGKLYGRPEVEADLAGALLAGDILLEKTPFRLTDSFIPGHWGHAAIWVGSEAELRALGIWEHPVVLPYQDAIRTGRGVVEALRSGVEMNPLGHFLNVDDLAVLRQPHIEPSERGEVIVRALRQVGKGYDFNFDVQTTDRIVCSELVYDAYAGMDWPTERHLGRSTISPDNIAVKAIGGGPFEVVRLYHDGERNADDPRQAMAMLVAGQAP